jgi:hypothetical protein
MGNNLESIVIISPVADLGYPASLPQGAGMHVYNSFSGSQESQYSPWGDGILTHLPFRSPDPTNPLSETST